VNRLAEGFSSSWVPYILVLGSLLGIAAAAALFPRARDDRSVGPLRAFAGGAAGLMVPVLILIAAWVLGSVIGELVTDEAIRELTGPLLRGEFLGALVFVVSAIVAFSIGSSWGTMGLMMPLALAFAFALDPSAGSAVMGSQLSLAIAAVFSGAVFGDHCSPFSDTTIVSSISTGVEPIDHVKTQLPYALVAAGVALLLGFLPAGLGWLPLVIAWLPGALALLVLVLWTGWRGAGR
jgi:Na+/H+ antiporter NhaC